MKIMFDSKHIPEQLQFLDKTFDMIPFYGSRIAFSNQENYNNLNNTILVYFGNNENSKCFFPKERIVNMERLNDLEMLRKLVDFGMKVPNFIYSHSSNGYFPLMNDSKSYLIKGFGMARSLGQMRVKKENINDVMYDAFILDKNEFGKLHNLDNLMARETKEENLVYDCIKNHEFYLSEEVKFYAEYRVLYFIDIPSIDFIIEERKGYQINSKAPREHKVIHLDKSRITIEILDQIKRFGDSMDYPMLSFDIYINADETWGVFEFSQEFGTQYKDIYSILEYQINEYFKNLEKKLFGGNV